MSAEPSGRESSGGMSNDPGVIRILDANLNRLVEGLRVVEEYARFVVGSTHLVAELKSLRHDAARLLASVFDAQPAVLRKTADTSSAGEPAERSRWECRDVESDVGTSISVAGEYQRESAESVCRANFQRAKEATRVLEEYAKTSNPGVAAQLERLRYRLYELESTLWLGTRATRLLREAQLYVLVDAGRSLDDFTDGVKSLVAAGVDVIQLRDKHVDDRTLCQRAALLRELTDGGRCLMVVNDRSDIARIARADGVHVGQSELTCQQVRQVCGAAMAVGVSTHSVPQALEAVGQRADYIGVGPIFPSRTKSFQHLPGPGLWTEVAEAVQVPAFAIGGIDHDNARELIELGCRRMAVASAIWGADDRGEAASRFKRLLPPLSEPGAADQ